MRNRVTMALLAVLVLVGLAATLSLAAGPKQYQWTGTVTDVDAKAKTMSVDKGGDIWEFSTESVKDLKVKKGDKVTVTYRACVGVGRGRPATRPRRLAPGPRVPARSEARPP